METILPSYTYLFLGNFLYGHPFALINTDGCENLGGWQRSAATNRRSAGTYAVLLKRKTLQKCRTTHPHHKHIKD